MIKTLATIIFILINCRMFSQNLEIIKSQLNIFENDIEKYKTNDLWGIWTMPIGLAFSSSELKAQGRINYSIKNISDYDLNTAWIPDNSKNGIGESFGFTFKFPENTEYGGAYQFFGQINLFNGYCKSLDVWQNNSRVKKLKVYFNNKAICVIDLIDTWHFQNVDIAKFFKDKRRNKYLDAPNEVRQGDKLTFKILEVYPGNKYENVALSEFMAEGAGN